MMGMKRTVSRQHFVCFAFLLAISSPAAANDSSAVLGAGGLELVRSSDIVMASEDLFLSPNSVRVRYSFRNESEHDVTTTVAFPLPDISQNDRFIIFLPAPDRANFVDFQVVVDGKAIQPDLDEKAVAEDGTDVTAALARAGVPLNARAAGWKAKVTAVPQDARQPLMSRGLLEADETEYYANWTLRVAFHWRQTFPARSTVTIEHQYKPIVGGASRVIDTNDFEAYKNYCLDESGKIGVRRLLKQEQANPQKPGISPLELSYVLTTGANWKGPIENFHLTIDKERPNAILSSCMEGLGKTGPTTFELRQANFTPKENIRLIVFTP